MAEVEVEAEVKEAVEYGIGAEGARGMPTAAVGVSHSVGADAGGSRNEPAPGASLTLIPSGFVTFLCL